jgi:hypothetical protein
MSAAFSSIPTANGTWTLRFNDSGGGDTGSVSAAVLRIEGAAVPTAAKNADFDGDGKTDFAISRQSGGTFTGENEFFRAESIREKLRIQQEKAANGENAAPEVENMEWWVARSTDNSLLYTIRGDTATDIVVPNDYDGDGKTDVAVWRPGAPTVAAFYILQSSTLTVKTEVFGQTGDDPAVTGDYDGDGKADVATYRCPPFTGPAGQCFFFFRGSFMNPSGNTTYVPWGFGVQFDFFVNPGDFDGDGKHDFCIQRANPSDPSQGQFVLLKSGGGVEFINWGTSTDLIIPGDYDGDGKADFCVRRTVSGSRHHWVLTRTGATNFVQWGVTGDEGAPGDYDGDGKTDFAVRRPNSDPNNNYFWVLRSSDGGVVKYEWGLLNDVAVAGWNIH